MLKSMTAYGRAQKSTQLGRFIVEIQTLNRKHLEINPALPKELSSFDPDVRKWIEERLFRGKVVVRVEAVYETQSPVSIAPNLNLVRQVKTAADKIAEEVGIPLSPEAFWNLLSSQKDALQSQAEEISSYRDYLKEAVEEALDRVCEMREREGKALEHDLRQRIEILRNRVTRIEEVGPDAVGQYREKLRKRLSEFEDVSEPVEREVAILAEKIDVTEEITRFRSHLKQFEEQLEAEEKRVGKTLDFLVQELLREANTMGSKSSDASVTRTVVEIKSELERIREQVQNIE